MSFEPILIRALLVAAICYAATANAVPSATKPAFKEGQRVRVAGCKTENGKDWRSTGYPNAELVKIRGCGRRGVVIGSHRACAPPELGIDSCDPWTYRVRLGNEGGKLPEEILELYGYQIGEKTAPVRNRMVDFFCDKKKEKCSVEKK